MKPSILVVITGDPRTSGRPAEAIRIAAGIGAWERTDVYLYLRGPAVLVLSPHADEWVDGDSYARYLPLISGFGRPVYIESASPLLVEAGELTVETEKISETDLAALVGRMTYVTRF